MITPVGLHGHLADGHIEALVQAQEGHHGTQGHAADIANSHGRARQSTDCIAGIAQLCGNGHDDVCVAVGLLGAFLQLIVQLAEASRAFCSWVNTLTTFWPSIISSM